MINSSEQLLVRNPRNNKQFLISLLDAGTGDRTGTFPAISFLITKKLNWMKIYLGIFLLRKIVCYQIIICFNNNKMYLQRKYLRNEKLKLFRLQQRRAKFSCKNIETRWHALSMKRYTEPLSFPSTKFKCYALPLDNNLIYIYFFSLFLHYFLDGRARRCNAKTV